MSTLTKMLNSQITNTELMEELHLLNALSVCFVCFVPPSPAVAHLNSIWFLFIEPAVIHFIYRDCTFNQV